MKIRDENDVGRAWRPAIPTCHQCVRCKRKTCVRSVVDEYSVRCALWKLSVQRGNVALAASPASPCSPCMERSGTIGGATDAKLQIAANQGVEPRRLFEGGATRSEMVVVIVSVDTKNRRAQQVSVFLRTPDSKGCAVRSFLPLSRSDSFLDTGQLPALLICQPAPRRQPPLRSRYKLPCAVLFPPFSSFDFFGMSMRF